MIPYRQVHLDFHTSEHITDIGTKFDKKQFQAALKTGHVKFGYNICQMSSWVVLLSYRSKQDTPASFL